MKTATDTPVSELITDSVSEKIIRVTERLVTEKGADGVSVSEVLRTLGVSNRVFYNRFHNIDEVLKIVYKNLVVRMRKNIQLEISDGEDFFEYARSIIVNSLTDTYDLKKNFSQYTFEHDSISEDNRIWWTSKIKQLFNYGIEKGILKSDLDTDTLSYFLWCLCRGCNADAVSRNLTKEEAAKCLLAGFDYFVEGVKA